MANQTEQDTVTVLEAKVWSTMPAQFRHSGRTSDHSINQKLGRLLDSFIEGPVFVPGMARLFLADIPYGRIFSIDTNTREWSLVIEYDGEPTGLAWHPSNQKIVIADFKQGILELDVHSGELKPLAARYHGERFKGPNDLVIAADGSIFFTDQGMTGLHDPTGHVYRLSLEGHLDLIISNGPSPNGLVFNLNETALFVAMTRDNSIWHVPFHPDGSVQRVGRFASYYGIGGPDGLALDSEGNLFVAHSTLGKIF